MRPTTDRPTDPAALMIDRPTEPRWLPITEAAIELGLSREALRGKVKRRTIRSRKGNDGKVLVLVDDRPTCDDDRPTVPQVQPDRPWDVPGTSQVATVPGEPVVPLSQAMAMVAERDALHREYIDRCLALAASERSLLLERIDGAECRAEQATAALNDLVERVLAMVPAPQPASWWERWFGVSRRSNLRGEP